MEHKHTYSPDLADRAAKLSTAQDTAASPTGAAYIKTHKTQVSVAALALLVLATSGVWVGLRAQALPLVAAQTATTSSVSLPADDVVAPFTPNTATPVLGAGTLVAAQMLVLQSTSPLALLSLTAGDVIPMGVAAFEGAPALPFDARVLLVSTETGEITVMRADAYEIVLPVAEAQIGRVVIGDTADVQFDALPAQTFTATVSSIAPMVTTGRGTVNVALTLQEPPASLRPNMAARITLCGCANTPTPENG